MDLAASRPRPIPVYAEMGSANPVFILPRALRERGELLATGLHASFTLDGQEFMAMDGGDYFSFAHGTSLFVACEDQAEVDYYWEKLTADGGEPGKCGWLTDKFGVSWQIIPNALGRLMQQSDPAKADKVRQAMLQMGKIDIAGLEQAAQ